MGKSPTCNGLAMGKLYFGLTCLVTGKCWLVYVGHVLV